MPEPTTDLRAAIARMLEVEECWKVNLHHQVDAKTVELVALMDVDEIKLELSKRYSIAASDVADMYPEIAWTFGAEAERRVTFEDLTPDRILN